MTSVPLSVEAGASGCMSGNALDQHVRSSPVPCANAKIYC